MLEKTVTNKILQWLNQQDGVVAVKHHGGGFSKSGEPDIYGSWRGLAFLLEVKAPGNYPTKLQKHRLRLWREQGGAIADVVRSVDDVKVLFEAQGVYDPKSEAAT